MTRRRAAWFVLGCAAVALSVAVLYIVLNAAQTTHAIREAQQNNQQVLATIHDCTQPGGKCYQRGEARTAGAVADINRVVILASACAVGRRGTEPQIEAQIQACVIQRLAAQDARNR